MIEVNVKRKEVAFNLTAGQEARFSLLIATIAET